MSKIILSENVIVSDPCYSTDVLCQLKLNNVLPGTYNVDVQFSDEGEWGNRVSNLTILHESIVDDGISFEWEDRDSVGVDSGQCGIFCETTYRNDTIVENIVTPKSEFVLPYNDNEGDKWYESMCKFTLSEDSWGSYETGVVTSSGIGDGMYHVELMYDKEKIVGIRVSYLGYGDEQILEEDEEVED